MRSPVPSVTVSLLLAVLAPLPASAQPTSQPSPRELLDRGVAARREQHDEEALRLFTEAYGAQPSAEARAQMALAEQALGRWGAAYRHLAEALAQREDTWVTQHRQPLEASFALIEQHVGRLLITCNVDGAELAIDGVPAGTLPMAEPLVVSAGPVVVDLRAEGYDPRRREIEVTARTLNRAPIDLVPCLDCAGRERARGRLLVLSDRQAHLSIDGVPSAILPLAEPLEVDAGTHVIAVSADGRSASHEVDIEEGDLQEVSLPLGGASLVAAAPDTTDRGAGDATAYLAVGITALALTAASVAVLVGGLVLREDNVHIWNDDAQCPPIGADGRLTMCRDVYQRLVDGETLAVVGGVAGGVFATASVVFFVLAATTGEAASEPAVTFAPAFSPDGVAVRAVGRF